MKSQEEHGKEAGQEKSQEQARNEAGKSNQAKQPNQQPEKSSDQQAQSQPETPQQQSPPAMPDLSLISSAISNILKWVFYGAIVCIALWWAWRHWSEILAWLAALFGGLSFGGVPKRKKLHRQRRSRNRFTILPIHLHRGGQASFASGIGAVLIRSV